MNKPPTARTYFLTSRVLFSLVFPPFLKKNLYIFDSHQSTQQDLLQEQVLNFLLSSLLQTWHPVTGKTSESNDQIHNLWVEINTLPGGFFQLNLGDPCQHPSIVHCKPWGPWQHPSINAKNSSLTLSELTCLPKAITTYLEIS